MSDNNVSNIEPLDTFNRFAVTSHENQVIIMGRVGGLLEIENALILAAWLIMAAELAGNENAAAITLATYQAIRET